MQLGISKEKRIETESPELRGAPLYTEACRHAVAFEIKGQGLCPLLTGGAVAVQGPSCGELELKWWLY